MRAGVYTGGGQGLPQASPAPLVHIEDVAGMLTFTQDNMDYIASGRIQALHLRAHQAYKLLATP